MKAFIKKIFSVKSPGGLAFFSTLLATLGSWCVAAWMTCAGVMFDFSGEFKVSLWFKGIAAVLALTALFCNLAFFYTQVPEKFKKYFLVSCALLTCAVGVSGLFFGINTACCIFIGAFLWLLPLAVFRQYWYWVIPGSVFYTAAAAGLLAYCTIWSGYLDWMQLKKLQPPEEIPWLVWCVYSCFAAFVFNANLYAAAEKKKLKQFLTPVMFILFPVALATYDISYTSAGNSEKEAGKAIAAFEKYFGTSTDAYGLYKLYFGKEERNAGLDFWVKVSKTYEQYDLNIKKKYGTALAAPVGNINKKVRQQWKDIILPSPEARELTGLFSGKVPLPCRFYETGKSYETLTVEAGIVNDFAKIQLWQLHFALEEKNLTQALEAFERLCKYQKITQNSFIFYLHYKAATFTLFQVWGMEKLLSSGLLKENDLERYLKFFEAKRNELPTFERKCIFGETLMLLDITNYIGQREHFLFPPLQYCCSRRRIALASSSQADFFAEAAINFKKLKTRHQLPPPPKFSLYQERLERASLRFLLIETLLKLELEKRRTGVYPETAPQWLPIDPFTGKKLHYRKGVLETSEYAYNFRKNCIERELQQTNAVAIWSSGPEQESSLSKNTDVLKALIRLPDKISR